MLNIQSTLTVEPKLFEKTEAVLRRCQSTRIGVLRQADFFILPSVAGKLRLNII